MSPLMNAWALLYEDFFMTEHSEYYYDFDRNGRISNANDKDWNDFWEGSNDSKVAGAYSEDSISFELTMDEKFKLKKYKYNEDVILKELQEYITGTYNQHYSAGDDKIQTLDLIEACGDGESFCRSNILKYASRYDKKGTARRDIMKILHYAVLLMYFNDKNSQRETYPQ